MSTVTEELFSTFTSTESVTATHFYISKPIDDNSQVYDPMLNTLVTASDTDSITIHLNCVGGSVATGIQILNAIKHCNGIVTTIVEGVAHSMATFIFLAGDIRIIRDNCLMLFHNYSTVDYGKGAEIVASVEATKKWMDALSDEYYKDFLTQTEIKDIKQDKDVWLMTKQVRKRLKV